MATSGTGYSGTPLVRKLGYKPGSVALLIGAPDDYRTWLADLPDDITFNAAPPPGSVDLVHLFSTRLSDLQEQLAYARSVMKSDGVTWVSWPKKASRVPTDITEDVVRRVALAGDLVDVKVCAVTETWSGLKLMVRKVLR